MFDFKFVLFLACAAFILGTLIVFAMQNYKKDLRIEQQNKIIDAKNDYIARLYAELKKAKGIDKPFMIPLDPPPDFDIDAVFKAIEEDSAEEAAEEEAEEGGAA